MGPKSPWMSLFQNYLSVRQLIFDEYGNNYFAMAKKNRALANTLFYNVLSTKARDTINSKVQMARLANHLIESLVAFFVDYCIHSDNFFPEIILCRLDS